MQTCLVAWWYNLNNSSMGVGCWCCITNLEILVGSLAQTSFLVDCGSTISKPAVFFGGGNIHSTRLIHDSRRSIKSALFAIFQDDGEEVSSELFYWGSTELQTDFGSVFYTWEEEADSFLTAARSSYAQRVRLALKKKKSQHVTFVEHHRQLTFVIVSHSVFD
jgi:hypothetical protein